LGELLAAAGVWWRGGRPAFHRRSLALLVAGGLAVAAWPATGIRSGSGGLLAPGFYALELANHPRGVIAPSLRAWLQRAGNDGAKWATLLPGILGFVLLARLTLGKVDREERGRLVFMLLAGLFAAVLACQQLRWWNLFDVFALAGLTGLFAGIGVREWRSHGGVLAAGLLFLPGLFVGFPPAAGKDVATEPEPPEAQALVERDFGYWLARRGGGEREVLFSTPVFSGAAAYYGGFDVVASSDDEHETGYLTAVRIASALTPQEVSILLQSRAVTHVALPLWDPVLDQLVRIGAKLPADQPLPSGAFAVALRSWNIPLWMRPMDYVIPAELGQQGFDLRVFALQAGQEPDLALGNRAGAEASLETLIPFLSRRWARDLPADRRVNLATLFIQTNRVELAREQITACFAGLGVKDLNVLTTGGVVRLLALSRSLAIPFPSPDVEAAARRLIPPGVRAQLGGK